MVTSAAFADNGTIPVLFTCKDQNMSPPLSWGTLPEGTKSLALIMHDPDTPRGTLTHWVVFNISPGLEGLPQAIKEEAAQGFLQGTNTFGKVGYNGPCPPAGSRHRYQFYFYALDSMLALEAGAAESQVVDAMQGHLLGRGLLTGLFGNP